TQIIPGLSMHQLERARHRSIFASVRVFQSCGTSTRESAPRGGRTECDQRGAQPTSVARGITGGQEPDRILRGEQRRGTCAPRRASLVRRSTMRSRLLAYYNARRKARREVGDLSMEFETFERRFRGSWTELARRVSEGSCVLEVMASSRLNC